MFKTTSEGGIQIHPHHLMVPGCRALGTENISIREQTLETYSEFLSHWEVAMGQCTQQTDASFTYLWLHDSVFRVSITEGLKVLGVVSPEKLRPVQMSELLLICSCDDDDNGDLRGAIFRLHSDSPKLPAMTSTPPPPPLIELTQPTTSVPWFFRMFPFLRPEP